jgi:hypothetical protein
MHLEAFYGSDYQGDPCGVGQMEVGGGLARQADPAVNSYFGVSVEVLGPARQMHAVNACM